METEPLKVSFYISRCILVKQFFAPREEDYELPSDGRDPEPSKIREQDVSLSLGASPRSAKPLVKYPCRAKAIYSYEGNPDDPHEISFNKNEIIDVSDVSGRWWIGMNKKVDTGIIPSNYCILIQVLCFLGGYNELKCRVMNETFAPEEILQSSFTSECDF